MTDTCKRGHSDWVVKGTRRYCRVCKNATRARYRDRQSPGGVMVSNAEIREHVQRALKDEELSPREIAERMGWFRIDPRQARTPIGDERRLTRALGMRSYKCTRLGTHVTQSLVHEETVLAIAAAIHLDPRDVGL